ncbi:carbohydrate-responsive element-binding protein-like [Ylistrum balloti]|uniref:carbohydrate-responsive element-binding protein-like n=1 Tax=Ylistrum balloti TaxID=509963 RepID=UPI002905A32D|nr:carbohydrate-responsive element-binding protein-like [Ylistrum balloti]
MKVVDDYETTYTINDVITQLDKEISTKLKVNNGHYDRNSRQNSDGNCSSSGTSPKQGRKCGRPANPVPRHKRDSHIKAEYKRRDKIQKGFDTLRELVPALEDCSPKESKSAMLCKTAVHCCQGKAESKARQDEISVLRQEIQALGSDIHMLQSQLPASGIKSQDKSQYDLDKLYADYVRERTSNNWKFWIFSFLMNPMYKAYKCLTASATRDNLVKSVLQWAADHLSLTSLRPGMLDSLTSLCKKTSIMTKPECLQEEALSNTQAFPFPAPPSPTSPQIPASVSSPAVSPGPSVVPHSPILPAHEASTDDSMDLWTSLHQSDEQLDTSTIIVDSIMAESENSISSQLTIDHMLSDSLLDSLAKQVDVQDYNLPDLYQILPTTSLDSLTPPHSFDGVSSTQSMNCTVISDAQFTQSVSFGDISESLTTSSSYCVLDSCNLIPSSSQVAHSNTSSVGKHL